MIALGLVCLLLAAAVTVGMLLTGTSQDVLFQNRMGELTTSPLWIFVAGVLVTLLTLLGVSFFGKGTKHRVARHKEMNRLRKVEQEHAHSPEPTTTAENAHASERGGDTGYRQQPDERPVVELAEHEQGQHEQGAPQSGNSVTLDEQRTQDHAANPNPSTRGATLDQPAQHHDR